MLKKKKLPLTIDWVTDWKEIEIPIKCLEIALVRNESLKI